MLKVNTDSTTNGMDNTIDGNSDTRATNHVCSKNSPQANGHLNRAATISSAVAKKSPAPRSGASAGVLSPYIGSLLCPSLRTRPGPRGGMPDSFPAWQHDS